MKRKKALLRTQRKSLDEKLLALLPLKKLLPPRSGWVKAIREALGMSTSQLAERMGIQQSGVVMLEKREVAKSLSLESLDRAARALNCRLVYALVPEKDLETIVHEQSLHAARAILRSTLHSMALEDQTSEEPLSSLHLEDLAAEIKAKMDRRLWSPS